LNGGIFGGRVGGAFQRGVCINHNYVFSRKIFLVIGLNIGVWRQ